MGLHNRWGPLRNLEGTMDKKVISFLICWSLLTLASIAFTKWTDSVAAGIWFAAAAFAVMWVVLS